MNSLTTCEIGVVTGAPAAIGPELVFISGDVADVDLLVRSMGAGREVHVLDAAGDGLAQMAQVLQGREGIGAVHVVSHGGAGVLDLGATRLDQASLAAREAELDADLHEVVAGLQQGHHAGDDPRHEEPEGRRQRPRDVRRDNEDPRADH